MSETLNSNGRPNKRRLKRLWLNPGYQAKYILWITLTGLILVAFQSLIFYMFTRENYALLVELSPMSDDAKAQLYRELKHILLLLGGGSLAFLSVVAVLGLVFSHRTVGPLYHFKRVFEAVKNGDRSARIRLRPTDDFRDVAQAFNEMMDSIK